MKRERLPPAESACKEIFFEVPLRVVLLNSTPLQKAAAPSRRERFSLRYWVLSVCFLQKFGWYRGNFAFRPLFWGGKLFLYPMAALFCVIRKVRLRAIDIVQRKEW